MRLENVSFTGPVKLRTSNAVTIKIDQGYLYTAHMDLVHGAMATRINELSKSTLRLAKGTHNPPRVAYSRVYDTYNTLQSE